VLHTSSKTCWRSTTVSACGVGGSVGDGVRVGAEVGATVGRAVGVGGCGLAGTVVGIAVGTGEASIVVATGVDVDTTTALDASQPVSVTTPTAIHNRTDQRSALLVDEPTLATLAPI
jgi:hypothetical protein